MVSIPKTLNLSCHPAKRSLAGRGNHWRQWRNHDGLPTRRTIDLGTDITGAALDVLLALRTSEFEFRHKFCAFPLQWRCYFWLEQNPTIIFRFHFAFSTTSISMGMLV